MQEIIRKIRTALDDLSSHFGTFELAALLEREEGFDRWDLVLCAPKLNADGNLLRDFRLVDDALNRAGITNEEKLHFARYVAIRPSDEVTREIRTFLSNSGGQRQYGPRTFGNMTILSGYLIAPEPWLQAGRKSMAKRPVVRTAKLRHRVAV